MPSRTVIRGTEITFRSRYMQTPSCIVNRVIVSGEATPAQIKVILAACKNGRFVPEKVGLPCTRHKGITLQSNPFCEISEDDFHPTVDDPTVQISMCDLTGRFKATKGIWAA